jgi:hypothetical protein
MRVAYRLADLSALEMLYAGAYGRAHMLGRRETSQRVAMVTPCCRAALPRLFPPRQIRIVGFTGPNSPGMLLTAPQTRSVLGAIPPTGGQATLRECGTTYSTGGELRWRMRTSSAWRAAT